MKYLKYNTKTMTSKLLFQAEQTPVEKQMPEKLKLFLKECSSELKKRTDYKLVPIMECNYDK